MNRPIKFRVWDKYQNKFLPSYGNLGVDFYHEQGESWHSKGIRDIVPVSWFLTDHNNNLGNYIVQQYTGLTDKNNKEIFEGDIVKEHHFDGGTDKEGYEYRGVVRHKIYDTCDEKRKFSGFITFPNELENKNYSGNPIHSDCEVIGNIFEHKHLLK